LSEGMFLPIYADSGTGKTTLAENLAMFAPQKFAPTLSYDGEVTADGLSMAVASHVRDKMAGNDERVIPVNIDHREGASPTGVELAQLKRFLRGSQGYRTLVLWPETSRELSRQMSEAYRQVAGALPLDIPVEVAGPASDVWMDLAAQTLVLANDVDSLEHFIDLNEYVPNAYASLGDYLKAIAAGFNRRRLELIRATGRDTRLTIVWVSESAGHGILSSLTSSRRFGMLDGVALVQACADSVVGKWWAAHPGLLVQTIVALDAHVLSVSPPLSLAAISRYGPDEYQEALRGLEFPPRTPADVTTYLTRADLGRRLAGQVRSVGEGRGNPAEYARGIFAKLADDVGFQGARDKQLNKAMAAAIQSSDLGKGAQVISETALPHLPSLIPDISIVDEGRANCLEFTYRKGDFLNSSNRSTIAQYCLGKLRNYARSLGWISASE